MNYKQKYEEAIERCKSWIRGEHPECFTEAQKAAEFIFPELRESEDERIRKGLIKGLSAMRDIHKHQTFSDNAININDAIAWLEKQGEQKSIEYPLCKTVKDKIDYYIVNHFTTDTVVKTDVNSIVKAMEEGVMIGMSEQKSVVDDKDAEKASEEYRNFRMSLGIKDPVMLNEIEEAYYEGAIRKQKSAWGEEDEKIINTIISDITRIRTSCGIGTDEYNIRLEALNWLKSFKPQQKQEWDNKDDGMLNCLITTLCEEEHGGIETNKRFVNWLKSIKDRVQPQPKQEWSEKDEKKLRDVIRLVEQGAPVQSIRDHYTNWLKSFKERFSQPHWKPSEQNIKDLEWCADLVKDKMGVAFHRLQVFIDEIKKL